MPLKRKALGAAAETLADRQVKVVCSTADIDRSGEIVEQDGIDLTAYQGNPVVLWQHDPNQPIARAVDIGVVNGRLQATVQFPDAGTDATADRVYGLIKAGIVNCTSIGFAPTETEPMDPAKPRGPQRYLAAELMEFSFVSIPANPGAAITARSLRTHAMPPIRIKGLYDVGRLAGLLQELGWLQDCASWEADHEGDGSTMPARLGEIMRDLGEALIAMTQEEVAELIADLGQGDGDAGVALDDDDGYVEAAVTPALRRFRAGVLRTKTAFRPARARSGRAISAANAAKIQTALEHHKSMGEIMEGLLAQTSDGESDGASDDKTEGAGKALPLTEHYRRKAVLALISRAG